MNRYEPHIHDTAADLRSVKDHLLHQHGAENAQLSGNTPAMLLFLHERAHELEADPMED